MFHTTAIAVNSSHQHCTTWRKYRANVFHSHAYAKIESAPAATVSCAARSVPSARMVVAAAGSSGAPRCGAGEDGESSPWGLVISDGISISISVPSSLGVFSGRGRGASSRDRDGPAGAPERPPRARPAAHDGSCSRTPGSASVSSVCAVAAAHWNAAHAPNPPNWYLRAQQQQQHHESTVHRLSSVAANVCEFG